MTPAPEGWVQFDSIDTIDGRAEVIDIQTGHAVLVRPTRLSATGVAFALNRAAAEGPDVLARALGSHRKRTTTKMT